MRSAPQLFRLVTEMVFILAGALLLWIAMTGQYLFDARRPAWRVLAVVLILWGLRSCRRARLIAVRSARVAARIGGGSLVAVGLIMLSLAWTPLGWVGLLLAVALGVGAVLAWSTVLASGGYICPITGEELPCPACCPLNRTPSTESYICPITGEELPCPDCCPLNR